MQLQIQKVSSLKYEVKVLPFKNPKLHKAETMLQMAPDELVKCIELIKTNTNVPCSNGGGAEKSAGAVKLKLHVLNYIGSMCVESSKVADMFIEHDVHKELIVTIRTGANLEM